MAAVSVFLATAAAALTHIAIRHAHGKKRLTVLALALSVLGLSFHWDKALGGFWPGVYTLLSAFILAASLTPWIELMVKQRHVG